RRRCSRSLGSTFRSYDGAAPLRAVHRRRGEVIGHRPSAPTTERLHCGRMRAVTGFSRRRTFRSYDGAAPLREVGVPAVGAPEVGTLPLLRRSGSIAGGPRDQGGLRGSPPFRSYDGAAPLRGALQVGALEVGAFRSYDGAAPLRVHPGRPGPLG